MRQPIKSVADDTRMEGKMRHQWMVGVGTGETKINILNATGEIWVNRQLTYLISWWW